MLQFAGRVFFWNKRSTVISKISCFGLFMDEFRCSRNESSLSRTKHQRWRLTEDDFDALLDDRFLLVQLPRLVCFQLGKFFVQLGCQTFLKFVRR